MSGDPSNAAMGALSRALVRAHRARSCDGKVRYGTMGHAARIAAKMSRKTGEDIRPYQCGHCGGCHTGHPPQWLLDKEAGDGKDNGDQDDV